MQGRIIAIGQTLAIVVAVSFGGILAKIVLSDISVTMPPITYVSIVMAIGMATMSIYTFVIRRERIPKGLSREVWLYIILIGICNFTVGQLFINLALEKLPATTHNYLLNFIGFVTMAMSIFIMKETPYVFQIIGAVVAIAGLRVFFAEAPGAETIVGIAYISAAIFAIAFTNNIARKLAQITNNGLSNNIISTIAILVGGGLVVVFGLITQWPIQIGRPEYLIVTAYNGIVSMAIGLTAWNFVLRTLRSYEASVLGATGIIWTALMAIPILREQLQLNEIIGMVMMLLGIVLVQIRIGPLDSLWLWNKRPAADGIAGQE